jgi:DNA-3-methyladenine glycosylase I
MRTYHDQEWGVPSHADRHLFEMLLLEGAQAGLSWSTILAKRENYRQALDGLDPTRIARYDEGKIAALLEDPGIVRNRLKVRAAVTNAGAFLTTCDEHGSFAEYLWAWVDGVPVVNEPTLMSDLPTPHRSVRPPEQRPETSRLHLRWFHDRLRLSPSCGRG